MIVIYQFMSLLHCTALLSYHDHDILMFDKQLCEVNTWKTLKILVYSIYVFIPIEAK